MGWISRLLARLASFIWTPTETRDEDEE